MASEQRVNPGVEQFCDRLRSNDPSLMKISQYGAGACLHPPPDLLCNVNMTDVMLLADALKFNHTLKELSFDYASIGREGAAHLAAALETNRTLEVLSFSYADIDGAAAAALAAALLKNKTLRCLALLEDDEGIGNDGVASLSEALKENTTLQTLILRGVSREPCKCVPSIVSLLRENRGLKNLDASGIVLADEEGIRARKHAMAEFSRSDISKKLLENMRLAYSEEVMETYRSAANDAVSGICLADNDGIQAIADAFAGNSMLTALHFPCMHEVSNASAMSIAGALRSNATLKELHLAGIVKGENAMASIFDALKENQTLTTLNMEHLNGCIGGWNGLSTLCGALTDNRTLTTLNLTDVGLTDGDVQPLVAAVEANQTLENLILFSNEFSEDGAKMLKAALKDHPTLKTLRVDHDDVMALWGERFENVRRAEEE